MSRASAAALAALFLAAGCGGGGSSGSAPAPPCTSGCETAAPILVEADVQRVVAQAAAEAQARHLGAHIVVVDRVGNVLAAYQFGAAPATVDISSGLLPADTVAGLDNLRGTVPAVQAAIAKAITGAYLSSQGNAFSTRTASQIVQEHFNPGELRSPSGPLYGVQFSQLSCSDVNRNTSHGRVGPKRSPLGLAADPGGLPLYKNGVLVGGIGIEADGRYGIDRDIQDVDEDDEENIAAAGASGFDAPGDIRGERITADGRTFRFTDRIALRSDPARAAGFAALGGRLQVVEGFTAGVITAGVAFGTAASGIRADSGTFAASGAWILADAGNANRFPSRAGTALTSAEVEAILGEAYAVARRARAQIRRPLGSAAEVTIALVDVNGDILGLIRTPDGPVFGIDVSVQKARTAMFFSSRQAASVLNGTPPAQILPGHVGKPIARYAAEFTGFVGGVAPLQGAIAWTPRAIGLLHRPFYPDGIDNAEPGPLSSAMPTWSPFNVGFQLDLVYNQLVKGVLGDTSEGCAARLPAGAVPVAADLGIRELRNGAQIFPGGVPVYKQGRLAGGLGVSGDGVDQDDMVAYLGLANAAAKLASGVGHAPAEMRADTLAPRGSRLRYVQCPQAPFIDSTEQSACR